MPSQSQPSGADQVDGFKIELDQVEAYLKQIVMWIRNLIMSILVLSLISIVVWNMFAPPHRDVPDGVIDNIFNALKRKSFGAITTISPGPNGTNRGGKA